MVFWILYLISGNTEISHPYHFAKKGTCVELGKIMVKQHKFKDFKCVQVTK